MTRLLAILSAVLVSAQASRAAVGDLIGASIEPCGWVLDLYFENLGTNAQFFNGFLTNGTPSTTNGATKSLTSMGYDDAGNGIQVPRTIFGTRLLQLPFGLGNTNDILASNGTNCVARVALSSYVYAQDSNLSLTISSAAFSITNTEPWTNCVAGTVTATNLSACAYQRTVGNWSWPPMQRWTSSTPTLRLLAYNRHAQMGRPMRSVRLVITDQHGVSVTNWSTSMSVDRAPGDSQAVCEYVFRPYISTLTQGDQARCDFTAFPWVGDTNSVLDTWDNANSGLSISYAAQTNLIDRTGAFGGSWAIVDRANGNDSTGAACTNLEIFGTNAFATINGALVACLKTNAVVLGRSNLACSTVYLTNGCHLYTGGNSNYGPVNIASHLTIDRFPGCIREDVVITNASGNKAICDALCVRGITISNMIAATGTPLFHNQNYLWFDGCLFNCMSNLTIGTTKSCWLTGCDVMETAGALAPYGGANNPLAIRGGRLEQTNAVNCVSVLIGTVRTNRTPRNAVFHNNDLSTMGGMVPDNWIFAYNRWMNWTNNGYAYAAWGQKSNTLHGIAIVQNVMESCYGSAAIAYLCADSTPTTCTNNNIMAWCNTAPGERWNMGYEDTGTKVRQLWSIVGNLWDDVNYKTDDYPTGNGSRTNNWSIIYGVDAVGNCNAETEFNGATANFRNRFAGLWSYQNGTATANPTNWILFVSRKTEAAAGAYGDGNGDYRSQSSSHAFDVPSAFVLPYDLDGNPRSAFDPPGAYVSGNRRKGGMF